MLAPPRRSKSRGCKILSFGRTVALRPGIFQSRDIWRCATVFSSRGREGPKDASAWIGLAASYDRFGRFDLADRAYREAIKLQGETTQILNNQGYSYMLRGKLSAAREKFNEAFQREPDNPTIENNINLLNGSYQFIQRDPQ